MSRPPNTPDHLSSAYNNRGGVIDFVNMPVALGNPYGMPYMDEVYNQNNQYNQPSIYAQAGFPGYASNQALNYQNYPMGMYQPIASPAYLPTLPMHDLSASMVTTTPVVPTPPMETQEELRTRINDKINDIIHTQKQNMLQSKIESLQNKVEQLSQNMGSSMGSSMGHQSNLDEEFALNPHLNRLSDKVEKLSQKISLSQGFSQHSPNDNNTYDSMDHRLGSPYAKHSEPDVEISRRLRRLAEESASRAADTHRHEERNNKIPDW